MPTTRHVYILFPGQWCLANLLSDGHNTHRGRIARQQVSSQRRQKLLHYYIASRLMFSLLRIWFAGFHAADCASSNQVANVACWVQGGSEKSTSIFHLLCNWLGRSCDQSSAPHKRWDATASGKKHSLNSILLTAFLACSERRACCCMHSVMLPLTCRPHFVGLEGGTHAQHC